jgi:broad specificity phosphatase PhoE
VTSFFITHPEVDVHPQVPIDRWRLSRVGVERAEQISRVVAHPIDVIVTSAEEKAIQTAEILAATLGLSVHVEPSVGELNRSSTGFLPPAEFDVVVNEFFASPMKSARGWERATDAQSRVVKAVQHHTADSSTNVAFVAHGGVGALLMASLLRVPISRALDQPDLGSYFSFGSSTWELERGWQRIPDRGR